MYSTHIYSTQPAWSAASKITGLSLKVRVERECKGIQAVSAMAGSQGSHGCRRRARAAKQTADAPLQAATAAAQVASAAAASAAEQPAQLAAPGHPSSELSKNTDDTLTLMSMCPWDPSGRPTGHGS